MTAEPIEDLSSDTESETIIPRGYGSRKCDTFLDLRGLSSPGEHRSKFYSIFDKKMLAKEKKGAVTEGSMRRQSGCLVEWVKQRMMNQKNCAVTVYCDTLASLSCHVFVEMVEKLQFCANVLSQCEESPSNWGWETFFQVFWLGGWVSE